MAAESALKTPAIRVDNTVVWPFVTKKIAVQSDGKRVVFRSRDHRKDLAVTADVERRLVASLWQPQQLNWCIGAIFVVGATLFALASLLLLLPASLQVSVINIKDINAIYFAGSIPFTLAAYLQLFQAANAPDWEHTSVRKETKRWFGWRPKDIGWNSCALQFLGTLLFNLNTFNGMSQNMQWFEEDLRVWAPDMVGSILFLASGYLAFIETCHSHFAWKPQSLSWWITLANLLGCVAFIVAAVLGFTFPQAEHSVSKIGAITFTLIGALGFFIGSLLMLWESTTARLH